MIYIMLCKMTELSRRKLRDYPELLVEATMQIGDSNNHILSHYATLGQYDLVCISQAESNYKAAELSMFISNFTGLDVETLATVVLPKQGDDVADNMPAPPEMYMEHELPFPDNYNGPNIPAEVQSFINSKYPVDLEHDTRFTPSVPIMQPPMYTCYERPY